MSASCHPSKMAAPRVAHRRHQSNAWETGGRRLPRHPTRELRRVPRHERSTQTPSRHRKGRHLARIRRLVSPFSESSSGRLKQTRPQFQDSPGRLPINATDKKKKKKGQLWEGRCTERLYATAASQFCKALGRSSSRSCPMIAGVCRLGVPRITHKMALSVEPNFTATSVQHSFR